MYFKYVCFISSVYLQTILDESFGFRKPELYKRSRQKYCHDRPSPDSSAEETAEKNKKQVTSDTHPTEFHRRDFIR